MKTMYLTIPTSSEQLGLLLRQFAGQRVAIVSGLDPGEPIFALRGHDTMAVNTIWEWLNKARERWGEQAGLSEARVNGVLEDIATISDWQAENPTLTRAPD